MTGESTIFAKSECEDSLFIFEGRNQIQFEIHGSKSCYFNLS